MQAEKHKGYNILINSSVRNRINFRPSCIIQSLQATAMTAIRTTTATTATATATSIIMALMLAVMRITVMTSSTTSIMMLIMKKKKMMMIVMVVMLVMLTLVKMLQHDLRNKPKWNAPGSGFQLERSFSSTRPTESAYSLLDGRKAETGEAKSR